MAEVLEVLGLGSLAREVPLPPDNVAALARERQAARERRDFAESDRLRDEIAARGWEVRAARTATSSTRSMADVVYGRRAVREALRGRREVGQVWCAPGMADSLDWLPAGARSARTDQLTERAGSPDHQGVVAEVSDYRYADAGSLLAGDRPLLVALDEVTDPHNLGAVARVAECAGADGLLITARRSARVTPAVCRVSAGAVEHLPVARVENLADLLLRNRRPGLWAYAAAADSDAPRPGGLPRWCGVRARVGGPGPAPPRPRGVRSGGGDPDARPGRVAERLHRGRGAPVRGGAPARWRLSSTSSTATTSGHLRGPGDDYQRARELLVAEVAGYMAQTGIDAVVVFDGHGTGRQIGRTRVTHSGRDTADTVIERLAHRHHAEREVTVVSSDNVLRHVAQRSGVHAMSAREFSDRLAAAPRDRFQPAAPKRGDLLGDLLDPEVRAALERIRRGE